MIARLAAGSGEGVTSKDNLARFTSNSNSQRVSASQNSSQYKKKRAKLLDFLLNTNWSKQSQQTANLTKLNKILLVCDANFLDDKSGESPLSLAVGSQQINPSPTNQNSSNQNNATCPHSASLFNLLSHSTSANLNQFTLQQTPISDLTTSKAPLVERILLLLIKSGALIDFRNSDGKTALHVAAIKSNFWALKTLLDLGASTDYRDINGLTPLYYSILFKANLKVTQLLLSHSGASQDIGHPSQHHHFHRPTTGAEISPQSDLRLSSFGITDLHGWQEVHQACKLGLDAHLDKLLYYGCDINAKIDGSGNTPLHVAAINDQLNCAKILLMRGANKTIVNNSHQTAHQVAVISNNMDLAEFISEHDESKIIPFRERPLNYVDMSNHRTNPLRVDQHQRHTEISSSQYSSLTGSSIQESNSSQTQSLLSIGTSIANQLNVQTSNMSPCLSQRSFATTSSSGVCCDADANSNLNEEIRSQSNGSTTSQILQQNHTNNNISIVTIGDRNNHQDDGCESNQLVVHQNMKSQTLSEVAAGIEDDNEDDDDPKSSGSGSSSNGLYSLMSEERPLFAGTIVEATSDYQSGDPNHLQLHRGDLIEVLECKPDLLQAGQLPKIANKPMIYGRRRSDRSSGLFPSFCVRRAKCQRQSLRQRLADISNQMNNNRVANITNSQSMAIIPTGVNEDLVQDCKFSFNSSTRSSFSPSEGKFCERQVVLKKTNAGFGFVLRGAKINPATCAQANGQKIVIDEKLMVANNLASLQYLDDIEPLSVSAEAGLQKGDFLLAVNDQDVRLCGHDQVVQMIRQSGSLVRLTVASSIVKSMPHPNYSSKTLVAKVKPEPPKRDPTTTLTRNKAHRTGSMIINRDGRGGCLFDANTQLPNPPYAEAHSSSPTGSLNAINRSMSTNLSHFNSAQSLSSAIDSHSISSNSTCGTNKSHDSTQNREVTPNHSSSSTATLTTVATMKPHPPAKPKRIQMNNHQPAVVKVTQRNSPQNSSPIDHQITSSNVARIAPNTAKIEISDSASTVGPPQPPPPPPPLPDFSPILKPELKNERRTSAPINQYTPTTMDLNRLQKKRESLAVVSQVAKSTSQAAPLQFGEVAAACAAAANNRIQRQQLQLQQQQESTQISGPDQMNEPPRSTEITPTGYTDLMENCNAKQDINSVQEMKPSAQNNVSSVHPEPTNNEWTFGEQTRELPAPPSNKLLSSDNRRFSATMGRSSAQIIHQPKHSNHHHSQSQTLRAKPKRPAIPDYNELPPPPPSLSPLASTRGSHQEQHVNSSISNCEIHGQDIDRHLSYQHEMENLAIMRQRQAQRAMPQQQTIARNNHSQVHQQQHNQNFSRHSSHCYPANQSNLVHNCQSRHHIQEHLSYPSQPTLNELTYSHGQQENWHNHHSHRSQVIQDCQPVYQRDLVAGLTLLKQTPSYDLVLAQQQQLQSDQQRQLQLDHLNQRKVPLRQQQVIHGQDRVGAGPRVNQHHEYNRYHYSNAPEYRHHQQQQQQQQHHHIYNYQPEMHPHQHRHLHQIHHQNHHQHEQHQHHHQAAPSAKNKLQVH